eukprot:gene11599-34303_t
MFYKALTEDISTTAEFFVVSENMPSPPPPLLPGAIAPPLPPSPLQSHPGLHLPRRRHPLSCHLSPLCPQIQDYQIVLHDVLVFRSYNPRRHLRPASSSAPAPPGAPFGHLGTPSPPQSCPPAPLSHPDPSALVNSDPLDLANRHHHSLGNPGPLSRLLPYPPDVDFTELATDYRKLVALLTDACNVIKAATQADIDFTEITADNRKLVALLTDTCDASKVATQADIDFTEITADNRKLVALLTDTCDASKVATQAVGCVVNSLQAGSLILDFWLLASSPEAVGALRTSSANLAAHPERYFTPKFKTEYGISTVMVTITDFSFPGAPETNAPAEFPSPPPDNGNNNKNNDDSSGGGGGSSAGLVAGIVIAVAVISGGAVAIFCLLRQKAPFRAFRPAFRLADDEESGASERGTSQSEAVAYERRLSREDPDILKGVPKEGDKPTDAKLSIYTKTPFTTGDDYRRDNQRRSDQGGSASHRWVDDDLDIGLDADGDANQPSGLPGSPAPSQRFSPSRVGSLRGSPLARTSRDSYGGGSAFATYGASSAQAALEGRSLADTRDKSSLAAGGPSMSNRYSPSPSVGGQGGDLQVSPSLPRRASREPASPLTGSLSARVSRDVLPSLVGGEGGDLWASPSLPRRASRDPARSLTGSLSIKEGSAWPNEKPSAGIDLRASPSLPRRTSREPASPLTGSLSARMNIRHIPAHRVSWKGPPNRNVLPRAVSSSSPPVDRAAVKKELFDSIAGTGRGSLANSSERGIVEEAQISLESFCQAGIDLDLLPGKWRLLYTTANDVLPVLASESVLKPLIGAGPVQVGEIYQVFSSVEEGEVENLIKLSTPFLLKERDGITVTISEGLESLIAPAMLPRGSIQQALLLGIKEFKFRLPISTPQQIVAALGGPSQVSAGYLVTYLDEDMLIGRATGLGGTYLFKGRIDARIGSSND